MSKMKCVCVCVCARVRACVCVKTEESAHERDLWLFYTRVVDLVIILYIVPHTIRIVNHMITNIIPTCTVMTGVFMTLKLHTRR